MRWIEWEGVRSYWGQVAMGPEWHPAYMGSAFVAGSLCVWEADWHGQCGHALARR